MCVIIDANVAVDAFLGRHADYAYLMNAIRRGRTRLIYGGKLTREYSRTGRVFSLIVEMSRSGRAQGWPDARVDELEDQLRSEGSCMSDDEHVIALARVSGARLLCTRDNDLTQDFKNRTLLTPKGKIYRRPSHKLLLDTSCEYRKCARCRRA